MALHCTGQADAEWLRRELQRPPARRVPQGAPVRKPHRGARHHRRMEERLQHQPTALEPQRAHTNRVRSSPQGGAKLEQTLLMIEGKLGSRSPVADGQYRGMIRWGTARDVSALLRGLVSFDTR